MIITRLKARIEALREELREEKGPDEDQCVLEGKIDALNQVVDLLQHEGKASFHTVTWSERDGGVEVKIALVNPDGVSRGLNLLVGDHFLIATYPEDQFMAKHLRRDDLYEGESGRDRDRIMGQIQAMIKDVAERLFPMQHKYDELDQADKEEVRYLERHMDELRRTLDVFAPPTTPYVMKNQDSLEGLTLIGAGPIEKVEPEPPEEIAPGGCSRCGVLAVAHATAKCSDLFHFVWPGGKEHDGYVLPHDLVGLRANGTSHDYVVLEYCLACGQIQGSWPVKGAASALKNAPVQIWACIVSWPDGHWNSFYIRARSEAEVERYYMEQLEFRKAVSCQIRPTDEDEIPPDVEIRSL